MGLRGFARSFFHSCSGRFSAISYEPCVASIPNMNSMPSSCQPSRRDVCVKSVSPRSVILRNPALRQRATARSSHSPRLFMTRSIAAPIDDVQCFSRVGQRHHQRVIAPFAFVIDVDTLLAFAPVSTIVPSASMIA